MKLDPNRRQFLKNVIQHRNSNGCHAHKSPAHHRERPQFWRHEVEEGPGDTSDDE